MPCGRVAVEYKPIPLVPTPAPTAALHLPGGARCKTWPVKAFHTIFSQGEAPPELPDKTCDDDTALGLRFKASIDGNVTSVRFWKSPSEDSKTLVARIYSWPSGALLSSTRPFPSCEGPAWVSVPLPRAARIKKDHEYVAVIIGAGAYPVTENYFQKNKRTGFLTAMSGVFGFTPGSVPPSTGLSTNNYYIDGT